MSAEVAPANLTPLTRRRRSDPSDAAAEASGRRGELAGRTFSVRDVCERYDVGEHTVLGWIRSGELKAVNVTRKLGSKRPSWRITPQAIEDFERSRTPVPALPRARRRKPVGAVIEFYPTT